MNADMNKGSFAAVFNDITMEGISQLVKLAKIEEKQNAWKIFFD